MMPEPPQQTQEDRRRPKPKPSQTDTSAPRRPIAADWDDEDLYANVPCTD